MLALHGCDEGCTAALGGGDAPYSRNQEEGYRMQPAVTAVTAKTQCSDAHCCPDVGLQLREQLYAAAATATAQATSYHIRGIAVFHCVTTTAAYIVIL